MSLKEQVKAMADMLKSPGWGLVEDWLKNQKELMHSNIVRAEDPDKRAVHVGFYRAVEQMLVWPKNYAEYTKQYMDSPQYAEDQKLQSDSKDE